MKYFRLVAGVGLTILILAAMMPWLTMTFFAQLNISLADLYRLISSSASSNQTQPPANGTSNSLTEGMAGVVGILVTLIVYPISLILGVAAMVKRKITPFAGVAGIISGASWMVGVDTLKSAMVQQGLQAGGLGGLNAAASLIITVGYGTYVAVIGGVIILVAYFITGESQTPTSINPQQTPTPTPSSGEHLP